MGINLEKHRRMELRKATGTRIIHPPEPPPTYKGADYAMAFACMECKKSFKRHFEEVPRDYPSQMECRECKSVAFNLGRNFKPPKSSDTKQWEKIKFLIDHGFRFQKIRVDKNSQDSVPYPRTLAEAREFVVKYKKYAITKKIT